MGNLPRLYETNFLYSIIFKISYVTLFVLHEVVLTGNKGLPHGPAIAGPFLVDCNVII